MGQAGVAGFFRALVRPQVLRTCRKCGGTWKVPRYFTRRHARGGGSRPSGGGRSAKPSGASRTLKFNEGLLSQQVIFKKCPSCGEMNFSQKRLWSEPKADHRR
jgi:hypothetical protein